MPEQFICRFGKNPNVAKKQNNIKEPLDFAELSLKYLMDYCIF